MRHVSALLLLLCVRISVAQTKGDLPPPSPAAPTAPLLSPQAAFEHASAPVDIIHRDIANWSDVELNSLTTAIAEASVACRARASETYAGGDLIAYARLCSLGKEWQSTYKAATTYINSRDPKPMLDQAYAYEVQAELNLGQPKSAVGACIAMMNSVPYGELTDGVTEAAVRYLQYAYPYDAITLLGARQPYVLHALNPLHPLPPSESGPSQPAANAPSSAASSSIPVHTLFEHALDFAAFEQYDNQPSMAASIVAQLDRNVPADLPPDEAVYIASDRRQYALIGTHFPELPGALSLLPASETPEAKPKFGSSTVFLLFPPWCAQCIRLAQQITDSLVRTAIANGPGVRSDVHIYALLADKPPAVTAKLATRATAAGARRTTAGKATTDTTDSPDKPETPKTASDQLRKTQTLVVAPSTLADFNANDFPFLIATDHNGIIRLLVSAAPNNALSQNGPIDQLTDFINTRWPPPVSDTHSAPPPPLAGSSNPGDLRKP